MRIGNQHNHNETIRNEICRKVYVQGFRKWSNPIHSATIWFFSLSKLFQLEEKSWGKYKPSKLSYVSLPLFFLQEQSFSRHFCILGRDRDISFPLYCFANSVLCFSRCFSYSFESDTFFGWIDIFLSLQYVCISIVLYLFVETNKCSFSIHVHCRSRKEWKDVCF